MELNLNRKHKIIFSLLFVICYLLLACEDPIIQGIWDLKTITFDSQGGSSVPSQSLLTGYPVKRPQNPKMPGFIFIDWYEDTAGLMPWDFSSVPDRDITLYAFWEKEKEVTSLTVLTQPDNLIYTHDDSLNLTGLTVKLEYDDGTEETVAFNAFASKGITANPAHGAKLIRGTVTAAGGTNIHNASPVTVTHTASGQSDATELLTVNKASGADVSVPGIADFSVNTILKDVTINITPLAVLTTQQIEYAVIPESNSSPAVPSTGWSTNTTSNVTIGDQFYIFARSAEDYNYTAGDAKVSTPYTFFSVTFNGNGNDSGDPPSGQAALSGTQITLPDRNTLVKTGETFAEWNTDAFGTGTNYAAGSSYTVTGNATFYAVWVTTPGSVEITLSVEQITDANINVDPIQLSRTNSGASTKIEIEITLSDYDSSSVTWEIYGNQSQFVPNEGKFEIDSADNTLFPSPGPYELIIRVKIGGTEFARTILVTILD